MQALYFLISPPAYYAIQGYLQLHKKIGTSFYMTIIRDIRKVRKRQHQYPEFGHTQGEILKKNLHQSTLAFKVGGETQKTINFDGS
jgi:hypothetical protein